MIVHVHLCLLLQTLTGKRCFWSKGGRVQWTKPPNKDNSKDEKSLVPMLLLMKDTTLISYEGKDEKAGPYSGPFDNKKLGLL